MRNLKPITLLVVLTMMTFSCQHLDDFNGSDFNV